MVVLFERPATGLFVFWRIIIPLLPILFFLAPGVWRNVCPLAAANQLPRLFGFSRSWNPPRFLRERGYVVAISLFFVIVATRKVILNDNGTALAILLAALLCMAFLGGIGFKGKSGWCSSICPLLPVQRLYGQTPFVTVRNNHCEPCVGCAKNCYDASPEVAYQTDLNDRDMWWATPRQFFAGAFPSVVLAFAMVPSASGSNWWTIYVAFACYIGLSAATFFALEAKTPVTRGQLAAVYGGIAINLFYFFNGPTAADTVHQLTGVDVTSALAPMQLLLLQLAVVWVVRTARVERRVVGESPADDGVVLSLRSPAAPSAGGAARTAPSGEPSVQFLPDDVTVSTRRGMTILEAASVRFRPIMTTTMAALMGAIPIAIGWGAGASTRRPLGVAVVGGLAFSQLVTLYVTPVFYTYLDELQQRFSRRRVRERAVAVAPEPSGAS